MPTSTATSSASSTCSKAAATTASSTWSTPRPARSTAPTPPCRSRCTTTSTTRSRLYAATKKANELMAHTYSHLYGLPTHRPALLHRLWSVGPAGHGAVPLHQGHPRGQADRCLQPRPRCSATSPTSTTSSKASSACCDRVAAPDPAFDSASARSGQQQRPTGVYNIGNHQPVALMTFIETLETALGRRPSRTSCRCSPATCRRPMPTSMI